MKKSELLKDKIAELQVQLDAALLEESEILIWGDSIPTFNQGFNLVGCYNLSKLERIMRQLADGRIVMLNHSFYGKWVFKMNAQRNRIGVAPYGRPRKPFSTNINDQEPLREDNALNIMAGYSGNWHVLSGDCAEECDGLIWA